MNFQMAMIVTLASVVGSLSMLFIAFTLHGIRAALDELVFRRFSSEPPWERGRGHAIFVGRSGDWVLAADMSGRGYRAAPPSLPPTSEGQVVKTASVKESEGDIS